MRQSFAEPARQGWFHGISRRGCRLRWTHSAAGASLGRQSRGARRLPGVHAWLLEAVSRQVPLLSGNLFHDAHTATLMLEHGIRRIVTRDMDFHRFPFLEVVDPLAAGS